MFYDTIFWVVIMDGFKSLEELYNRVKPALKSKCKDLKRVGINYVQEVDVWNFLKNTKWINSTNLTLGDMVNDIMTVSNNDLEKYVKSILMQEERRIN